ncbi:MAG TPA: hypothetical protein VFE59_04125 [Trebonia sp.]|jgi:hypothetical protein|nr:hypothetical protein [Trebonia sp.]
MARETTKRAGNIDVQVTRLDKPFFPDDGISELHVFLSSLSALDQPGQLVFDLDPPDVAHFEEACRHALDLRELLEGELGLTAYVKATGGKGLHVHVPLRPDDDFDSVRGFAREIAGLMVSRPGAGDANAVARGSWCRNIRPRACTTTSGWRPTGC